MDLEKIPYGHEKAMPRPSNPIKDRLLRHKIEKANNNGVRIQKPVFMEYLWVEKNARRDLDNISSFGRKVIQDALVDAGVLRDDGWKEIVGFSDQFRIDKENPRIEVRIVEMDGG